MEKTEKCRISAAHKLTLIICLFASIIAQAQSSWITLPNGKTITADQDNPKTYVYEVKNGETKIREMENPKEVVKIVITLKEKPIAFYKSENSLQKISLASNFSLLKQTHASVSNKIENIAQRLSSGSIFHCTYKINREYFTALNGIAMECSRAMIQQISELPEVKSVHLDREVKAYLTQSVKQIRADIVQDSLGYKGDGVLVGVLDTGIDFDHPALGGGYGPGYRVIGGYDFINDDNSPSDDEGHGTHVAGIIGANGNSEQIGVAPNVKFLAVKILDHNGMGFMSGIISGIEYCMDPDGNPETDDAVDIINMSLGGYPVPENPVDAAVNNATQAGILSVIAAGNEGDILFSDSHYQTITSPGTAETALTVGAAYIYDLMANFSSRGPDPVNFAIKPEIAAPGVDIPSLYPNNGMEIMSGTSMAAPHVAGVAALVKEQHPDWTPLQIKAALINSAKSMKHESKFARGNGRVDALNAATLGVMVEPGIINFGLVDLSQSVWMDTVNIKVKNLRNVSQNFNLEIQIDWSLLQRSGLPVEVELFLSQTSFELAEMEEKEIAAIISVPQSVPFQNIDPLAYTGDIICQSDLDSIQIPFGFIKSHVLVVECDIYPRTLELYRGPQARSMIDVLSRTGGFDKKLIITVPKSTYLLFASMRDDDTANNRTNHYFIVRDSVRVDGLTDIILNRSEAEYVAFNGVDQLRDVNDNLIAADSSIIGLHMEYLYNKSWTYLGWQHKNIRIFFSSMDERFIVHQDMIINNEDQSVFLADFTKGVKTQDDLTFSSGSQNLGDIHLNLDYTKTDWGRLNRPPLINRGPFVQINKNEVLEDVFEGGWVLTQGYALPTTDHVHFMSPKLTKEFNPMQYLSMSINISNLSIDPWYGLDYPAERTGTPEFYIDENRNFVFFDRKFFRPDQKDYVKIMTPSSGDTLYVSENYNEGVVTPKFQFLYQYYGLKDLGLTQFSPDGLEDGGIISSNGIRYYAIHALMSMHPKFKARMYSQNRLLHNSLMASKYFIFYSGYEVEENANRYRLLANTRLYNLLGQKGNSTIDYEFCLTEPVNPWKCNIPSLDFFQVLENNKPAQWLHLGQDKKVRIVIFDPKENVDSVGVFLLKSDGSEIKLATTQASIKEYFATIPDNIPDGFLDVIARVHSTEDNKFELTVSPAFYSGKTLDSSFTDARLQMIAQTLHNPEFIVGDTLNYTLTFINYGNRVAEDISVNFAETDYFLPVSSNSVNLDSLIVTDDPFESSYKLEIPLRLVFLGKKQADEKQCYYYPTITWNSGERSFTRNPKILVDFESTLTGIHNDNNTIPNNYSISQNYPNPFNPSTKIKYSIPNQSNVSVKVFDVLGREVVTLVNKEQPTGNYEVEFDASNLTSGIYFYRIQAGQFVESLKMVLMK